MSDILIRGVPLEEMLFSRHPSEYPSFQCIELPAGHGRLIDADQLEQHYISKFLGPAACWTLTSATARKHIAQAPTIIPADKEVESDG